MSFAELLDITKWRLGRLFSRRRRRIWAVLFLLGICAILFRVQLLRGIGNFLIYENELSKADAIFVLGGNTYDRTIKAAELFTSGYSDKIITLGANVATVLKSTGDSIPDALIAHEQLLENGVPDSVIIPLVEGTSTQEESEAILNFCLLNKYKKIIVVSDKFHTRRISYTFIDHFKEEGVEVLLSGSSHSAYDENFWWKSEVGMIMVNNEYVKILYYWWKY